MVRRLVDQFDPPARGPLPASRDLDPPVVVGVPDSVVAEARYLLLLRHRRWVTAVAVKVSPSEQVLESDEVAVADRLSCLVVLGLPVQTLDAPQVVVVRALKRGYLLLARSPRVSIVQQV